MRRAILLLVLGLYGLYVVGVRRLGVSCERLGGGLVQIGWFITLMIPPDPGSFLPTYIQAMGETPAIAFLGTFVAAALCAQLCATVRARQHFPRAFACKKLRHMSVTPSAWYPPSEKCVSLRDSHFADDKRILLQKSTHRE